MSKLKTLVKDHPEAAKRIGVTVGAILGVTIVGVVLNSLAPSADLPIVVGDTLEALAE